MVLRNKELKEKLLEGVNLIGDVVGSTLGPKGKLVLIDDSGIPYITKDGVTVAKSMSHSDPVVNSAIELVKQVADKTVKDASDGTSTSIILAKELITKGFEAIKEDTNIVEFIKGIDYASEIVVNKIKELARPVETVEDAKNVANISANGDKNISDLIGEALKEVGLKGTIHVVKNSGGRTFLDVTKGFKFAKGLPQQFLDKSGKSVIDDPYVIIYNGDLNILEPVKRTLQDIYEEIPKANVVLLAHSFGGGVLDSCLLNRQQNILNIYPIEAPSFGPNRNNILEDIANLVSDKSDLHATITEPIIGHCGKVIATKDTTTIFDGTASDINVMSRIEKIENEIKSSDDILEVQVLKERVSNLKNNVATLYIGGLTDADINERADRIDDAVGAVRSAVEEGVVLGAGSTYLDCEFHLIKNQPNKENDSFINGYIIVMDSLLAPLNKLKENSNLDEIIQVDNNQLTDNAIIKNCGINFSTNKVVDLWNAGIIDSAKVARTAFENAIAVAKVFLNINSYVKV